MISSRAATGGAYELSNETFNKSCTPQRWRFSRSKLPSVLGWWMPIGCPMTIGIVSFFQGMPRCSDSFFCHHETYMKHNSPPVTITVDGLMPSGSCQHGQLMSWLEPRLNPSLCGGFVGIFEPWCRRLIHEKILLLLLPK